MDNMERKMNDVKNQVEKGMRSIKYTAKYGIGFNVPNPIVRGRKEESIDTLMKRLYIMPLPKGNEGLVHGVGNFDDDEDGEEEDDDGMQVSSVRSGTQSPVSAVDNSGNGFGSGVRSFSKGLSSVSDSSTSSSTSASGNGPHSPSSTRVKSPIAISKRGGADDDDEGGGPDEGEDDDGFGAMNISAHRIPTEDTALTRFIRRAIVNNGEAAQISHLKNMEWVSMPRSEEEILATLDKRFYQLDFDPALHMLESFPAQLEDFNAYVEKQLSEKDIAKEHIMAELATRVEANYHVLIEGMKNVQEVDLDLTATSMQTVECRRRLSMADHGVLDPLLHILHKRIRRENLQKVANVVKGAHGALLLEREAKTAFAAGRHERAVIAATDAKLALDSDVLKNVNMMDEVAQSLDKLLPELRLAVDKSLRRLCSGRGGGGSSAVFLSTEYSWILRAYLTLDDHGIRLSSKPRSAVNASPLYVAVEGVEPEDSLAVGIVPIAPTVDRGGIPGLSERIQRFTAMELDYCIKVAVIGALMAASAAKPVPTASSSSTTTTSVSSAASTAASLAAKALRSASPSPTNASASSRVVLAPTSSSSQPQQQQQQQSSLPPPLLPVTVVAAAAPDVVRDVHGRIIAWKGRRLNAWAVTDLIKQLPAGATVGVLGKLAEQVAEILHRFFLLTQWHRSPFDVQNKEEVFLHRPADFNRQKSDVAGGLSDEEEEEDEDEDGERSPGKKKVAAAAAVSGGKEGCDDEEEDEEGDEGFTSPIVQDGCKLDAAEKARVLKERKEGLERARLAAVARGLKQVRKQLWVPIERAVVALLNEEELGLESLVQVLATGELLVALGEEFGHNDSAALKKLIYAKCELVLEKTHQECFGIMRQMLDRETWFNVPISVEDLGGMAGVVNNHVKPLSWPAMNGWGRLVKERVLSRGGAIKALDAAGCLFAGGSPLSILCKFVSVGNPFLGSSLLSKLPADPNLAIFSIPPPAPASSSSSSTPAGEEGPASPVIPRPTPVWTMTQAALNGFARYAGRYLQLMHLYPAMALETYTALLQLLDFYVYMVFAIFVPEQSVQLFLTHTSQLNRESSVVEEMSWANQEVHVPLPCEAGTELAQLRSYLNRIRDDLIESEHWGLAMGVEAANKIKKLGADTAKMYNALAAASGATGSLMMGSTMGGGRPGSPGPPVPARQQQQQQQQQGGGVPTSSSSNSLPQTAAAQRPQSVGKGGREEEEEESSDEEDGAGDRRSAAKVGSKRIIRKIRFQRPAFITETLEDADALFGLSHRAVAVESCVFVLGILKSLQPQLLLVLPDKKAALGGGRGTTESYLETATEAISQLRILTYRCAAPRLIGAAGLVHAIEAQQWNQNMIREEANPYTDEVCGTCRELWEKIKGPEGGVVAGMGGGVYIPPQVQLLIWTEVTQSVMGALLEGFARVERCSTEGRSLMSMDLQAVQGGLDEIQKVRPIRGKVHVDNYVKAFYYGEADVMAWIEQNYQSYFFRYMAGLLNAGVGQKKKRGLRELIIKVASFYAPEEEEEGEEEGRKESEDRGAVHGAGKEGSRVTGAMLTSSLFGNMHSGTSSSSSSTARAPTTAASSSSSSSSHTKTSISSTFSNMMQGKGLGKGFL